MNLCRLNRNQRMTLALLVIAALGLEGCSGLSPVQPPLAPEVAATLIYTPSLDGKAVVGYPTDSTGQASPITSLSLPAGLYAESIATDSTGQIYIGAVADGSPTSQILVFPAGFTGSAAPTRTITVPDSIYPWGMSIDAAGLLYVATQEQLTVPPVINVYAATANGSATPIRTINLPVGGPIGINDANVDAAGNIYVVTASTVSNNMVIEVFGPTASGLATPERTILANGNISGVSVDAAGDIFANVGVGTDSSAIEEFAPDANGQSTPVRTINLAQPSEFLRLDAAGNIYTSILQPSTPLPPHIYLVQGFSPAATGDATPFASFTPVGAIGQQIAPN